MGYLDAVHQGLSEVEGPKPRTNISRNVCILQIIFVSIFPFNKIFKIFLNDMNLIK